MADVNVFLDALTELVSVHAGHHDIAHDDVGLVFPGQLQSFFSVGGRHHLLEVLFQNFFQKLCHLGVVIGHENPVGGGIEICCGGGLRWDSVIGNQFIEIGFGRTDYFFACVP